MAASSNAAVAPIFLTLTIPAVLALLLRRCIINLDRRRQFCDARSLSPLVPAGAK